MSVDIRGYCQDALNDTEFISLVLPQYCFLALLSSLQLSKISKHGKSAVPDIENWKTLEHPA